MVVLEPAGSVLVIRQHSLGGGGPGCGAGRSLHHQQHQPPRNALEAAVVGNTPDHNQNRIVVVRSSAVPVRCVVPYMYGLMSQARGMPCYALVCAYWIERGWGHYGRSLIAVGRTLLLEISGLGFFEGRLVR